jgi:NADH-quinone oxidoreductase subunit M
MLSLLILLPLLGAAATLLPMPAETAKKTALAFALAECLLSLAPLFLLDFANPQPQLLERYAWIPSLHVEYLLGVDGLSAPFLPLAALLSTAVMLASWHAVRQMAAFYHALLLVLLGITQGVFCALDLIGFFLFWELTLIPLYFLISLWGIGPRRRFAAGQYLLMMMAGGVPLLFGFVLLALNHAEAQGLAAPAGLSFDYLTLLHTPMAEAKQGTLFLLLFIGFAVKAPLFPFHVWLPRVAMEGPVAVTALLAGLKLGAYGLLRFALPLAPAGAQQYLNAVVALAMLGIVYGALVALAQTNLRRLLAFAGVSHVGYVVLGIASLTPQGTQGAMFQLLNFTVIAGGLFLLADFLYQRLGSTELTGLGGLAKSMPRFATLFFLLGLAGMGVPGSNGFAAEHLIVLGAFRIDAGLGLLALAGTILGAAYFLGYCRRALFGPLSNPPAAAAADLLPRELLIGLPLIGLLLLGGLFPQAVLNSNAAFAENWLAQLKAQRHPIPPSGQ